MEFRARMNGDKRQVGYLVFTDSQVEFHEDFSLTSDGRTFIPAEQINDINIQDTSSERSKTSILRTLLWGWKIGLLFPKHEINISSIVEITTINGEYFYFEVEESSFEIRSKISRIVNGYFEN